MQRAADVFIVTRRSWQSASIRHVLALRQDAVRKAPASSQGRDAAAVILGRGTRFRIEKILFQEWMQEPETQERARGAWQRALQLAQQRQAVGQRANTTDLYNRSMRSYWKTTVFHRYGGEVWLFTLIATGRVHFESVRIVNEIYEERIREQAGREPVSDPAQAVPGRALASSQGQSREVVGVQHTKPHSALLRDAARLADKKWKRHDKSWWDALARGRLSARAEEWYHQTSVRLQEDADQQWAVANEESDKVGVPYKGRDGGAREKLIDTVIRVLVALTQTSVARAFMACCMAWHVVLHAISSTCHVGLSYTY